MLVEIDSPARMRELLAQGDELHSASRLLFCGESIADDLEAPVGRAITAATKLVELSFADTGLSDACLARLVDRLGRRPSLESLTFHGLAGDKTATAVAGTLRHLPALVDLGLDETRVASAGLRELARHFTESPQLERLRLARIDADDDAFAECIRSLPKRLKLLELFDNPNLGEQSAAALSDALPTMTQLEYLSLSVTGIKRDGVSRMLRSGSPSLRDLSLDSLDVGAALEDASTKFPRISKLSLRETDLTDAGCAELAAWLKLESLRELNLTYNRRITSSGVKSIAKSLPAGSRLQSLDLASTSCGNEGLLALVAAFSKHERPPTVDLSATKVTAAVFSDEDAIASSLRVNLEWCHGVSSNIRFPCALSQACAQHRSSE